MPGAGTAGEAAGGATSLAIGIVWFGWGGSGDGGGGTRFASTG
jgi:hypothetical protein